MRPTCPVPGGSGLPSSSITIVSGPIVTVGAPPGWAQPALTISTPLKAVPGRPTAALGDTARLGERGVGGDALPGHEVDPAAERAEHILVAPHHALGHARGAARVEEIDVVVGTSGEVPRRRRRRQRRLVAIF